MWFNSIANEEPYQGLKCMLTVRGNVDLLTRTIYAGAAWSSSARALKCSLKWGNERNPYCVLYVSRETAPAFVQENKSDARCTIQDSRIYFLNHRSCIMNLLLIARDQKRGRKEGMTTDQHGPLMPWATHVLQWSGQWVANP